jgi:ABC-type lipoprotein release transport system permease subunit
MIWSVAWRNIWRNKLRSIVIIIAITIGIFAGVFTWAFYRGMVNQRIQTAIITESSHIQIHHKNFLQNPDQKFYIQGIDSIARIISHMQGVKAVSKRMLMNAMISSAETGAGVKITGIYPVNEKRVTNIYSKITNGKYLEKGRGTPIVIGQQLAKKLSVKMRSKLVITIQTVDGTLTSGLFRVAGLYKSSNSVYDEMNVFVQYAELAALINLDENNGHELAVLLESNEQLENLAGALRDKFPELDVKTWKELMPEVSLVEETTDISMYVFLGIILTALIFGIINTMLMAVLERVKELGMLMAIGMNRIRVFMMILLETVLLSLTGGITGIVAGYLVTIYFGNKGIDLSRFAEAYEKLGYESMIYPISSIDIDIIVACMVLVTGILASIYPAWKAIQLNPAEALHSDI